MGLTVSRRARQATLTSMDSMRGTAIWRLLARNTTLRRIKFAVLGGDQFYRVKHYIPSRTPVERFFAELENRGVGYVVLRWFEDLPRVTPGRDLDILVREEDATKLVDLLVRSERRQPDGVPCDVYGTHGSFGSGPADVAYYPPNLAERIINGAERHPSGARVPCREDHFHSMAFHALYHKGPASGVPVDRDSPRGTNVAHDYTAVLEQLAARLKIDVPINMVDLDRYLGAVGWRPPLDTLGRWSDVNEWCGRLYEEGLASTDAPRGLIVAIVREQAAEGIDEIAELFRSSGFQVRGVHALDGCTAERASHQLRGGNWGRGPFPRSAGMPFAAIVAVDPSPIVPTASLRADHPGIDNARIKEIKSEVRDWWNGQVPASQRCNVLHTSDSAAQAIHYLDVLGIKFEDTSELERV